MAQLISPEYAALNRDLHEERDDFGAKGAKSAPQVVALARQNGLKVILDYGCGKGSLKPAVAALALASVSASAPHELKRIFASGR